MFTRIFLKLSLVFFVFTLISCADDEGRGGGRRGRKGPKAPVKKADLPASGAKIALVFPAGAGAMRASLAITENMEKDLGLNNLSSVIDVAGGVSSGSLMAAAMTSGKVSSSKLKPQLSSLVKDVFPETNNLVDKLVKTYNFTLVELEAIFTQLMESPPDLSSQAATMSSMENILTKAATKPNAETIALKLAKAGTPAQFLKSIGTEVLALQGRDTFNAATLAAKIKSIIGDVTLSDPTAAKVLTYASHNQKPAYFGAPAFEAFVDGPFAVPTTRLSDALVSSSAIPGFIKAPTTIAFKMPGGGPTQNLADLKDGVFATPGRFDPSAIFYEIFTKMFADEELLIVYVGNGAPEDLDFRKSLAEYGYKSSTGIAQKTLSNGKKVTFVSIKTDIVDDKDNPLFNVAQFVADTKLEQYMDNAGKNAVASQAYEWAIKAMQAAIK